MWFWGWNPGQWLKENTLTTTLSPWPLEPLIDIILNSLIAEIGSHRWKHLIPSSHFHRLISISAFPVCFLIIARVSQPDSYPAQSYWLSGPFDLRKNLRISLSPHTRRKYALKETAMVWILWIDLGIVTTCFSPCTQNVK